VTFAWDGTSQPALRAAKAGRFDPSSSGYSETSTSDYLTAEYAVTLAPGETKRFVHFIAMRLSAQDQIAASSAIAAEPTDLDAGLTAAERDSIQNWTFDADHDGVHNALDNCPTVANAGQENLDGDSKGDACDDDIDGDGLSNAIEATLRTDPRKVDTDGDGKNDPADSCPTIAAATDTGCPAPVVIPPSDKTAPVITIGGTSKVSLKTLLTKGLKVTVSSNEPTSFSFQIVGAAKGAKLSKVGDLIVATKSLAAGNGKRTVTITIAKKWRKAIGRKSKLTLQTVGTDASGNRTAKSSKLKLTK
jgi:Thrombospondin type 3 repeat